MSASHAYRNFWAERRAEIIARDKGRCVWCGRSERLTVHHIRARAISKNDSPRNLVTLCELHHTAIERIAADVGTRLTYPVFLLIRYLRK